MNLKNYTSSTPAHVTISYIEAYLAGCGVEGITKQYTQGVVTAMVFNYRHNGKTFTIRIPAKVEEVWETLWRDYLAASKQPRKAKEDFKDQAARTAWKIQQEWVQIQMSLVKLKQADFIEVFIAFVWDGEQTFFERIKASGFKALPEKT